MKNKLYGLLLLLVLVIIPAYLWWNQALKPVNPLNSKQIAFSITKGEDVKTIAQRLEKERLIRSSLVFYLQARLTNLAKNIQAGDFLLSELMDMNTISQNLQHGTTDIRITIPEGWRNEEIAMKVALEFSIPESEFIKVAKEGFMFPDTYFIPKEATASEIAQIFLANFNAKIKQIDVNKLGDLGLTLPEAIIIASIVEREAKFSSDRPLIASVILNRINLGMKLDVDATVQYTLGYQPQDKSWWKRHLTVDDLEIDSPFNTYKNAGLPPAAIANPGLSAIVAVIDAPETSYLYYVADKTGKSHFAKTFAEHAANISKYLNR